MRGKKLVDFCKCFEFMNGMGDNNEQMLELQVEISQLLAGSVDHPQIDSIVALVGEKALPNSDGVIYPEDILKRFGCTSVRDMYPAPAEFEKTNDIIFTKKQHELTKIILKSQEAIIIHAAGGVGKSVFAREIPRFLTDDSVAVIYDSFGAGKYRNRSQPRHRYRDGLIQIVNELAGKGLCDPLIAQSVALEDEILRKFLSRLQIAIDNLKKINQKAQIIIVIDAADNAEMAAKDFGQACFVHELLREKLPDDCHLVMLCRTERIELLQPGSSVKTYELLPFSEQETLFYLRKRYPDATEADGLEFHRLTDGNPRIQANALDVKLEHISEVLENLGPRGTTIEKQIENQLDKAVEKVKEKLPHSYQKQIDAICCGLATLPPFIPLTILATVAEVEEAEVKSFVAELGRPIWIADVIYQGDLKGLLACNDSITGQYLSGKIAMPVRKSKKNIVINKQTPCLTIRNAKTNNLKDVSVSIPLGVLVGIAGVSGSGKSSLISDTLIPLLKGYFHDQEENGETELEENEIDGEAESAVVKTIVDRLLDGVEHLSGYAEVSQAPIGKNMNSNPVSYLGIWEKIRKLFAGQPEAIRQQLSAGHFSFNSKGACPVCGGSGRETIWLGGNLNIYITCRECHGKRYRDEALSVRYKDKTIVDILEMSVSEAAIFFEDNPGIVSTLKVMERIGMGYIKLGQPTPTLSGGEAQRIKLAKEIGRRRKGNILYVLDEPTTGLSLYDTALLIQLLDELVAKGNSVVVIEHDLVVLQSCDWMIELGPGGGVDGGRIIAEGSPQALKQNPKSVTGRYLSCKETTGRPRNGELQTRHV